MPAVLRARCGQRPRRRHHHAELDGDRWIVNGQKVWNTSAHHADFGMLVARTNWDVPKHRGLTYFVLPMQQPGVEVRTLRQMNYHRSFNEVFLTDARIPRDCVVGDVDDGWTVALDDAVVRAPVGVWRSSVDRHRVAAGPGCGRGPRRGIETLTAYRGTRSAPGRADLVVPHAQAAAASPPTRWCARRSRASSR